MATLFDSAKGEAFGGGALMGRQTQLVKSYRLFLFDHTYLIEFMDGGFDKIDFNPISACVMAMLGKSIKKKFYVLVHNLPRISSKILCKVLANATSSSKVHLALAHNAYLPKSFL